MWAVLKADPAFSLPDARTTCSPPSHTCGELQAYPGADGKHDALLDTCDEPFRPRRTLKSSGRQASLVQVEEARGSFSGSPPYCHSKFAHFESGPTNNADLISTSSPAFPQLWIRTLNCAASSPRPYLASRFRLVEQDEEFIRLELPAKLCSLRDVLDQILDPEPVRRILGMVM